jgi:hypothetical protein
MGLEILGVFVGTGFYLVGSFATLLFLIIGVE